MTTSKKKKKTGQVDMSPSLQSLFFKKHIYMIRMNITYSALAILLVEYIRSLLFCFFPVGVFAFSQMETCERYTQGKPTVTWQPLHARLPGFLLLLLLFSIIQLCKTNILIPIDSRHFSIDWEWRQLDM